MPTGSKVRNYMVDDERNRNWYRALPRIREARGVKDFRTLKDGRVVFLDGPSQGGGCGGGGGSSAGFTVYDRGMPTEVTPEVADQLNRVIGRTEFGESIIQDCEVRWCQENARREYWAQKEAGNNPVYVIGKMQSVQENELGKLADYLQNHPMTDADANKFIGNGVDHAWVEVGGKIIDSTPFIIFDVAGPFSRAQDSIFSRYTPQIKIDSTLDSVLGQPVGLINTVRLRLSALGNKGGFTTLDDGRVIFIGGPGQGGGSSGGGGTTYSQAANRAEWEALVEANAPAPAEVYRWANPQEIHDMFLGKRTRSLDISEDPDFYFAPTSVLDSDSFVEHTYGRFVLDGPALQDAGWTRRSGFFGEQMWAYKPSTDWRTRTDADVITPYVKALQRYELISNPGKIPITELQNWLDYRMGRHVPIVRGEHYSEENITGREIKGNFITIDDRVVFIGGPGQGGGGSSASGGGGSIGPAPIRARIKELAVGMTDEQMRTVEGWLTGIPDSDLAGLDKIQLVGEGDDLGRAGYSYDQGLLKCTDGSYALGAYLRERDVISQKPTLLLAEKGFNEGILIHELGHHVTMRGDLLGRNSNVSGSAAIADVLSGRDTYKQYESRFAPSGLKNFVSHTEHWSAINGFELMADIYITMRRGSPTQKQALGQLWNDVRETIPGMFGQPYGARSWNDFLETLSIGKE